MVLDNKTIKLIEDFIYTKPRTIQEVAHTIQKNWRTANSYVERIAQENGTIAIRTFREGTRGTLKLVFWNNIERLHSSEYQEKLFKDIQKGKTKYDFSAFDIYQCVDENKRDAFLIETNDESRIKQDLSILFNKAKEQILLFSGNLSWLNNKETDMVKLVESLARKGIKFKILTRIDIASINNLNKITAINQRIGKDMIDIRHAEQPIRAHIIDDKLFRIKEVKDPSNYKEGELDSKTIIYYDIKDVEWVDWMRKVFFNLFRTAIPLKKRSIDLQSIKNIRKI